MQEMRRQAFYSHDFLPHDFVARWAARSVNVLMLCMALADFWMIGPRTPFVRTADVDRLVPPRVSQKQQKHHAFTKWGTEKDALPGRNTADSQSQLHHPGLGCSSFVLSA